MEKDDIFLDKNNIYVPYNNTSDLFSINQILPKELSDEFVIKFGLCYTVLVEKKSTSIVLNILKGFDLLDLKNVQIINEYNNSNSNIIDENLNLKFFPISINNDNNDNEVVTNENFRKNENIIKYDLEHLKLVKNNKLKDNHVNIIAFFEDSLIVKSININETINNLNYQFEKSEIKTSFEKVLIPLNTPYLKSQFNIINEIWPSNYKLNKLSLSIYEHSEEEKMFLKSIYSEMNEDKVILFNEKLLILEEINVNKYKTLNPLDHPVMILLREFSKKLKMRNEEVISNKNFENYNINNELKLVEKEDKISEKININTNIKNSNINIIDANQYYLKDLNIILFKEPCIMCTYALVHSRVNKIYFKVNNKIGGGCHSTIKILDYKINHLIKCFKVS